MKDFQSELISYLTRIQEDWQAELGRTESAAKREGLRELVLCAKYCLHMARLDLGVLMAKRSGVGQRRAWRDWHKKFSFDQATEESAASDNMDVARGDHPGCIKQCFGDDWNLTRPFALIRLKIASIVQVLYLCTKQ